MTKQEAAQIVAALAAAFPAWPPSRETVAIYVESLVDLDYSDAAAATRDIIQTEDRFPPVATIRRRIATRAGVLAPSAAQAWDEVNAQASDGGRRRSPMWTHPAVADTVRSIGWYNLCATTNPETMRSQFLRLYEDYRKTHDEHAIIELGPTIRRKALSA